MLPGPSADNLVRILSKCTEAKHRIYSSCLYSILRRMRIECHQSLGNSLVSMLVGIDCMRSARHIFDDLSVRSESSWNDVIQGHIRRSELSYAFALYRKMHDSHLCPNGYTYASLLKCCVKVCDIDLGLEIHANVSRIGLLSTNLFIHNTLVDMYAKCGSLTKAQETFDDLLIRDEASWTIIINAYFQHGRGTRSVHLLQQMMLEGLLPNSVTFLCSLKACSSIGALDKGKEIHVQIEQRGLFEHELVVYNALIDMYARCSCLMQAQLVFDHILIKSVSSWNTIIAGYVKYNCGNEAIEYLQQMQLEGFCPNDVTFICSINACGCVAAIDKGKELHAQVMRIEYLEANPLLGNSLVDMYTKCGMLEDAEEVFDSLSIKDIVAWTSLIGGYVQQNLHEEAFASFKKMQLENINPNPLTFACMLKSCGCLRAVNNGRHMHSEITKKGLEGDLFAGNAMIDMYAKYGLLEEAQEVLVKLTDHDTVSWNTLITGYVLHDRGEEALNNFRLMQLEGTSSNVVTFLCILSACGSIGAAEKGMEIHVEIERTLASKHFIVGSALLGMYAKCGLFEKAYEVFDKFPTQDTTLWNTLITGCAQMVALNNIFHVLRTMEGTGHKLNTVTFLSIMNCCSHAGLVEEGLAIFNVMNTNFDVHPTMEHYTCILDLLCRAGQFERTLETLDRVPFHPHTVMLTIVLGASRKWGIVELGEGAFGCSVQLDDNDVAAYVCMYNIYADAVFSNVACTL